MCYEFSPEFIEYTKKTFQEYSKTPLSNREAYEIAHNLVGFVTLLLQWDDEEQE